MHVMESERSPCDHSELCFAIQTCSCILLDNHRGDILCGITEYVSAFTMSQSADCWMDEYNVRMFEHVAHLHSHWLCSTKGNCTSSCFMYVVFISCGDFKNQHQDTQRHAPTHPQTNPTPCIIMTPSFILQSLKTVRDWSPIQQYLLHSRLRPTYA